MKLPTLPTPKFNQHLYTAEEVLAFQAATVEACAAVCEHQNHTGSINQEWMRERCAEAIRSLLK